MSIYLGTTPIAVNSSSREIGEIIQSTIPLSDAGLHLLDGSLISGSGSYSAFVTYISGLVSNYPDLFETEANWQSSVTTYGVCGKFVYDSVNNTVRLPKITGFTEGTIDPTALGDLVEAGLPNITGSARLADNVGFIWSENNTTGAFTRDGVGSSYYISTTGRNQPTFQGLKIDASLSTSIYGNSSTVQPQSIKVLYYIVIANSVKTNIEVDIDEIATDLNGKADVDLSNVNVSGTSLASGWSMPSSRYIDLTLGASDSNYTAPANGWFTLGGNGAWFSMWIVNNALTTMVVPRTDTPYPRSFIPVTKGDIIQISYYNFTAEVFRFIYAEGEN